MGGDVTFLDAKRGSCVPSETASVDTFYDVDVG